MKDNSVTKTEQLLIKNRVDSPLVSVIIPVFNVEKYLEECINSILCQTLTDIEILCIVSFHSKCKVWGQCSDMVQQFKEPCQRSVPRIFRGRIGGAPLPMRKSSASMGWNKKGPCSNPVLLTKPNDSQENGMSL